MRIFLKKIFPFQAYLLIENCQDHSEYFNSKIINLVSSDINKADIEV